MSNVFISHSKHDKSFVRKLAASLVGEGFPVWLDSWKLELGDSLLDKIYEGIETSSVVILVISKKSVESGWVNRELNASLAKEEQTNRKFLLPIVVEKCKVPLKVADRLYADFSASFSQPFTALADTLANLGCRDFAVEADREILPVAFSNVAELDTALLKRCLTHVRTRHPDHEFSPEQFAIIDDEQYLELYRRLHARIDNVETDPYYSANLFEGLQGFLDVVRSNESALSKGLALLLKNKCSLDSMYWFARIVRGRCAYWLWHAQIPEDPQLLDYGHEWSSTRFGEERNAASFFGVSDVAGADLWRRDSRNEAFPVWIDEETKERLRLDGVYYGPDAVPEVCSFEVQEKYLIPQMVVKYLTRGGAEPIWNMEEAIIGIR